ncbi:MAG: SprB repeat-containing protein [Candidatus Latescibacteria bacterium]|nr:SprB repeat-containing protein [Candidatus Latescibacterota bacterium]
MTTHTHTCRQYYNGWTKNFIMVLSIMMGMAQYAVAQDLAISATTTGVCSPGGSEATIQLSVTGGTLPYTYDWSTGDPVAAPGSANQWLCHHCACCCSCSNVPGLGMGAKR